MNRSPVKPTLAAGAPGMHFALGFADESTPVRATAKAPITHGTQAG